MAPRSRAPAGAARLRRAIGAWYLTVDVLALPRFEILPGPSEVFSEWTSRDPAYGVSLFTSAYYADIWASLRRVLIAFTAALALGIPLGLYMGWSRRFREYTFPLLELIRPIPILAWVPLAIIIFNGSEPPVLFLTFLAAFFATTLNTLLGVQSIDRDLLRAAALPRRPPARRVPRCGGARARCRTSSPGCRSRWAWRGSRSSPAR